MLAMVPTAPRSARSLGAARFRRSTDDRLVTGVCGGLAERWGTDVYALRLAVVLLTLAGGLGAILYVVAFRLSALGETEAPLAVQPHDADPDLHARRTLAVGFVTAGILLAVRGWWLWPGDAVMVPAALVVAASGLLWYRSGRTTRDPLGLVLSRRRSTARLVTGSVLALVGIVVLVNGAGGVRALPVAFAATTIGLAGAAVIAGPYIARLITQLGSEQRERIRTEERAAVATHLHDSVLQTLALMQRSSDDPRRMVALARRQERELRAWLYGQGERTEVLSLQQRLDAIAAEIELDHDVAVDLVTVGDSPVGEDADALLGAVREATLNAARHSGVAQVSVFVEVEDGSLFASVRDTGCGFDPTTVPGDRRGVTGSIRARIERAGGTAVLHTGPTGTEWELTVPRSDP